ncbi:MAG: flotillin family protein [Rudaea sp.]|uniref:SPFH domain-containing protein n=1 Tax=unclassified Rudaea TaxID=2627037 RepID=UPI0010F48A69|nr:MULTISPECIES: SPFH domain-containing protein [unclassified Rudaea]MBN8886925.1 flotillin family protein [Rudaea sp.]
MSWLNTELSLGNIVIIVGVIVALMLLYSSVVYVPNNRVGVLERLWAGKGSVKRGLVALSGEAGYVPDLLRGGFHLLFPFQYRVHKVDLVTVPQGEIGYVFARDGRPLEAGQTLGANSTHPTREDREAGAAQTSAGDFEDVRSFLAGGGQKGPQRKVLREGVYAINIAQFIVLTRANTYAVALAKSDADTIEAMRAQIEARGGFHPVVIGEQSGQSVRVADPGTKEARIISDVIGIVTVHDGPGLPAGELIAPAVGADRSAAATYHNNFQDADRFLAAGGFRGRQYQVLVDGTYYVNRLFASVEFIEKTLVPMGMVGVIVSFTGRRGADRSGAEYQHGELVGEGERGVWEAPMLPGKYPFNRFAGSIVKVPTTNFILKWESGQSGSDFDRNLKEISLITKDAFEPTLPLSVVVHIDYKKAAKVIQRFGDVQKLVEQTLDPMVSAYFKNTAQTKTLIELLQQRADIQGQALADMKGKFAAYNLELQEVLIGTPKSPAGNSQIENILAQLRDRQVAREQIETYEQQEAAAVKERTLREAAAVAAQQKGLTESRIAIEIAENKGLAEVKTQTRQGEADAAKIRNVALADAERIKAIGAANANRIELEGEATARAAHKQVEAYGGPEIRLAQEISAQITKAIADGKLPVVPQILVGGDGKSSNAIEAITAMILAAGQQFRQPKTTTVQ